MKFFRKIACLLTAHCALFSSLWGFGLTIPDSVKMDQECRKNISVTGSELAKKHDLKLIGKGLGTIAGTNYGIWSLSFTAEKPMTIDEVRPIVADMAYTLLYQVFHEKIFSDYQAEIHKQSHLNSETIMVRDVGFRLAFWDKDVNRPLHPNIAQVRLTDGKIYYHYADPQTQALQSPVEETLEQAGVKNFH